jgi:hypothetical protein
MVIQRNCLLEGFSPFGKAGDRKKIWHSAQEVISHSLLKQQ